MMYYQISRGEEDSTMQSTQANVFESMVDEGDHENLGVAQEEQARESTDLRPLSVPRGVASLTSEDIHT